MKSTLSMYLGHYWFSCHNAHELDKGWRQKEASRLKHLLSILLLRVHFLSTVKYVLFQQNITCKETGPLIGHRLFKAKPSYLYKIFGKDDSKTLIGTR